MSTGLVRNSGQQKVIKKPVEAIQCENTFSTLQRKVYNVLLANAYENLSLKPTHSISLRELCQSAGYYSNDYEFIKARFRELQNIKVEWDIVNEDGHDIWTIFSPLSLASINKTTNTCTYEFTPGIIPLLKRPAQYAKINIETQAKFKSKFALALYENCLRYKSVGQTKWLDIETLRKLVGVTDGKYTRFYDFKKNVIFIAEKEIKKYADFMIETHYRKESRIVTAIKFFIIPKKKAVQQSEKLFSNKIDARLKNVFALSDATIQKIRLKYSDEYILEKAAIVEEMSGFGTERIKSPAGLLVAALKDDYQAPKFRQLTINSEQEKLRRGKKNEEQNRIISYKNAFLTRIDEVIKTCDLSVIQIYEDIYNKKLDDMFYIVTNGKKIPSYTEISKFISYLFNQYPNILSKILSLKEFNEGNISA